MRAHRLFALTLLVPPALPAFAAPGGKTPERPMRAADQTRELARKNDRLAKVELRVDLGGLGEGERASWCWRRR